MQVDRDAPTLHLPNLQSLQLNIPDSIPGDDQYLLLTSTLTFLTSLNPVELIFKRSGPRDVWTTVCLLSDDWKGFRRAWTNLSLVRFVNVNILSEGVFLWEVDPTPYTQAVFRFVWEVKGTEYDAFVSQTLLGEVLGDVEKARNREAG